MSNSQKALEFKVGVFVFIGFAVIAGLVLYFGRVGEGFKGKYTLIVQLPNAGGLLKHADVQMAGAKIGEVSQKPKLAPGQIGFVDVKLEIYSEVKIPRGSTFKLATSGLLGDVFVEVKLKPDFDMVHFNPNDPKQVYQQNEVVPGSSSAGLEEIANKSGAVLDDVRAGLADLRTTINSLNGKILTDENAANIKETLAHLKATTKSFDESSKKLSEVMDGAQNAVNATKETMTTVNAAAGDLRKTIGSAKEALDSIKVLAKKATNGDGLLGTLINNRQLSDNVQALVANLREHGLLFYRNSAKSQPPPEQLPRPKTTRSR